MLMYKRGGLDGLRGCMRPGYTPRLITVRTHTRERASERTPPRRRRDSQPRTGARWPNARACRPLHAPSRSAVPHPVGRASDRGAGRVACVLSPPPRTHLERDPSRDTVRAGGGEGGGERRGGAAPPRAQSDVPGSARPSLTAVSVTCLPRTAPALLSSEVLRDPFERVMSAIYFFLGGRRSQDNVVPAPLRRQGARAVHGARPQGHLPGAGCSRARAARTSTSRRDGDVRRDGDIRRRLPLLAVCLTAGRRSIESPRSSMIKPPPPPTTTTRPRCSRPASTAPSAASAASPSTASRTSSTARSSRRRTRRSRATSRSSA